MSEEIRGSAQQIAREHYQQHGMLDQPVSGPVYRPVDIYPRFGFNLMLDGSSLVDKCVIDSGTWEPDQLAYIAALTERFRKFDKPMFLDIGSYWGLYSLIAMQSGVFETQYAFEADRHNFRQLQANLFLNKTGGKIQAINKAVSSENGTVKFWDSINHPDGNRAGVGVIRWEDDRVGYPVEAVSIDKAIVAIDRYILMKLDVEGHEAQVLQGLTQTVANNKVVMQVEIFEQQHDQVFAEVERLGLRTIHKIYPDHYLTNMGVEELGI